MHLLIMSLLTPLCFGINTFRDIHKLSVTATRNVTRILCQNTTLEKSRKRLSKTHDFINDWKFRKK